MSNVACSTIANCVAGIQLQNEIETRPDVIGYTTEPLIEEVEITGPISLILYVATSAPSTDFVGKLVDVHPDGKAYNITEGILRRSYEHVGEDRGQPEFTRIEIEMWPTSIVVSKGHQIRLDVTSSNFPRFDRNPNTGRPIATETETLVARQQIHHHASAPSHIVLPLIPRRLSKN